MSDPYVVDAQEHGIVRVFATDMPDAGTPILKEEEVAPLLGDSVTLDASKVQVIPAKMLESMGVTGYLRDGHGIPDSEMEGKEAVLDAMTGLIIVVPSSAFQGRAMTLAPSGTLKFIGAFHEARGAPPRDMDVPDAAKSTTTPPPEPTPLKVKKGSSWTIILAALLLAAILILWAVL